MISQTQIQTRNSKTAWYQRYWTVVPFRVKTQWMRFFHRSTPFIAIEFGCNREQSYAMPLTIASNRVQHA